MYRIKLVVLFFAFLSFAQLWASEKVLSVTNRSYGSVPKIVENQLDKALDELEDKANNEVFPHFDTTTYLKGIANSVIISGPGIGADYDTMFRLFLIQIGLSGGLDRTNTEDPRLSFEQTINGVAAQTAFQVGVNPSFFVKDKKNKKNKKKKKKKGRKKKKKKKKKFKRPGRWDLKRFRFFGHFATYTDDDSLKGAIMEGVSGQASFGFSSFGLHTRYKAYDGIRFDRFGLLKWDGVSVITGFRYTSLAVSAQLDVNQSVSTQINQGPINAEFTAKIKGKATVGGNVSVTTIPIEVLTSVKLLHIFSLFTGLGVDLSVGHAESLAALSVPLELETKPRIGDITADVKLNLGDATAPTAGNMRLLAGFSLEIFVLSLTGNFNYALFTDSYGAHAGLQIHW